MSELSEREEAAGEVSRIEPVDDAGDPARSRLRDSPSMELALTVEKLTKLVFACDASAVVP